jgi:hypothetical protein
MFNSGQIFNVFAYSGNWFNQCYFFEVPVVDYLVLVTDKVQFGQHVGMILLELAKKFLQVWFRDLRCGGMGGFRRSNPDVLSMTVCAAWSITILLCARNGSPRITGTHKEGAIMARTVFEVQSPETSYKDNFTHSVN